MKKHQAFTLIELLIVVAIIAILAAIAVPNFLEAQVRSKVARVKADMRTAATGIEAYFVDNNHYPPHYTGSVAPNTAIPVAQYAILANQSLWRLTTPVAYLTSVEILRDSFNVNTKTVRGPGLPDSGTIWDSDYMFWLNYEHMAESGATQEFVAWCLRSLGPDNADDAVDWRMYNYAVFKNDNFLRQMIVGIYDPTNGTISNGDIPRFGGEVPAVSSAVSD